MASIFKRSRDKQRRRSCYYISFDDENGKRVTKKGFTDKRATEDYALELEQQVRRRKAGLIDPKQEKRTDAAKLPIGELIKEFGKCISKNSPKHVSLTLSRIRRLVREAELDSIKDIDIESIESVLDEMLESEEISRKTFNHYVSAMKQFGEWLVPTRLQANPLAGIKRLNADVDVKRPRRALAVDEFSKLVESARRSNKSIQCFDGETRSRIYLLSYFTGLRRKEIASLTPASFDLKSSPATLTVEAISSKHRKKDILPIHPELAVFLQSWLRGMKRTEQLFPKLATRRTSVMVKKDLERVGVPYLTDEGYADFHACRHTFITELLRTGATLPEAKELARHSDVRMTMKYAHIGLEDQAKALSNLPWDDGSEKSPVADAEEQDDDWQRPASGARHVKGHLPSSTDTEVTTQGDCRIDENTHENRASGSTVLAMSLTDTQAATCGEEGSIPAASTSRPLGEQGAATSDFLLATGRRRGP